MITTGPVNRTIKRICCIALAATAFLARAETAAIDGDQALDTGEPPAIRFRDTDRTVERTGTDPRRFEFAGLNAAVIDLGTNRLHCARAEGEPESIVLDLGGAGLTGTGPIALDMRIREATGSDSIALVNAGDIAIGGIETSETSPDTRGDGGAIAIGTADRPVGSVRVGFLHAAAEGTMGRGHGGNISVHGSGDVRVVDAAGKPGDISAYGRRLHGGNVTVAHQGRLLVRHIHSYTRSLSGSGWVGSIRLDGGDASGDADIKGDVAFWALRRNSRESHRFEARNYRNVRVGGAIEGYSSQGGRRRANDALITDIAGDIEIGGRIDLERRAHGRLRGDDPTKSGRLVLEAGGTVTIAELDLRLVSEALLSSGGGTGASAIRGELTGFDPSPTGGTGTPADPFVSSQTILRAPAETRIYYNMALGKNADFAPFSYRLADADGRPGQGGVLMPNATVPAILTDEPRQGELGKVVMGGRLAGAGQSPATVSVYWAEGGDRGTDAAAWPHTHAWPPHTGTLPADYTHTVAAQTGTRYTYRFTARNAEGEMWTAPQTHARTARVFDIGSIEPARWLDGAAAAVSFTWDDNQVSQRDIATIFNEYGWRASFFVNPGQPDRWAATKDLYAAMSEEGHEIGNHTYTHRFRNNPADFEQANGAIEALTGVYPVSFVHPRNITRPAWDQTVFEHHLVARISSPHGMDGRVIHNDPGALHGFRRNLDRITQPGLTETGGWLIVAGHGMDGDGFRPIEEDQLRAILDHLKARPEPLWVGTMGEVGIYESIFQEIALKVNATYDTLALRVAGFDPEKYARAPKVPLTVALPLHEALPPSQIRLNPDDASARIDHNGVLVTFDLKKTVAVTLSLR